MQQARLRIALDLVAGWLTFSDARDLMPKMVDAFCGQAGRPLTLVVPRLPRMT